jgi:uroporphyrinogen-III synthase
MTIRQVNLLHGLHLLVTRPTDQAHIWARQLRELGAVVTVQPMLVIKPLTDGGPTASIADTIRRFDEFQKVIFISQNAVVYGVEWLSRYWPRLPRGIAFFAIGATTASSLESKNVSVQFAGISMNSEALLELAAMQSVDRQKILIFRGRGGRDHLGNLLGKRGARVQYCELYQRMLPSPQVQTLSPGFYKSAPLIPITTVHSGETLINLMKVVVPSQLTWLKKQPLLTPGERVAAIAAGAGFTEVIIARNATHKGMTEALYEWRQRQN